MINSPLRPTALLLQRPTGLPGEQRSCSTAEPVSSPVWTCQRLHKAEARVPTPHFRRSRIPLRRRRFPESGWMGQEDRVPCSSSSFPAAAELRCLPGKWRRSVSVCLHFCSFGLSVYPFIYPSSILGTGSGTWNPLNGGGTDCGLNVLTVSVHLFTETAR